MTTLQDFQTADTQLLTKLQHLSDNTKNALVRATIDCGYPNAELSAIHETLEAYFPNECPPIYCEDDPEAATAQSILWLERAAEEYLAESVASPTL